MKSVKTLFILTANCFFFSACLSATFENAESQIGFIPEETEVSESEQTYTQPTTTEITLEEKIPEEDLIIDELPSDMADETEDHKLSRTIYAVGKKDWKSLYNFYVYRCPKGNRSKARKIAKLYVTECAAEGINSDVAFIQMCHETGFLQFGNLVQPKWNNFCGLGAINEEQPGLKFKTMQEGVRAHIQHLHAYGTTSDIILKNELVDPRYRFVNPRGKAPDVFGLAGTWAADREYGNKLDKLLDELERF